MASVNKVIIVGNLGRDPKIRYMPDGVEKYATDIVAEQMQMLGGRSGMGGDAGGDDSYGGGYEAPAPRQAPAPRPAPAPAPRPAPKPAPNFSDMDDDIPF